MAQPVGSNLIVPGGPHFFPSISDSHSCEWHLNLNFSWPQRPEGSRGDTQHFNQCLFPVRHFFTRRPYEALASPLPWDGVSYDSTSWDIITVECLYGLCISVGPPRSSDVGLLQPPAGMVKRSWSKQSTSLQGIWKRNVSFLMQKLLQLVRLCIEK